MIEAWHVREALRFRFGSALVDIPGIWDRAAKVLQAYAPYKEMDDGSLRRIRSAELKDAADDVMGVLFDQLKVYSVTYESLHQYCIDTGSFSAMRVLYTKYADFMPASERKIIARIIRDNRPRSVWENWLDPEDIPPLPPR